MSSFHLYISQHTHLGFTAQEFHACQEEFNRKHETYFRLHQIIQANRSDFVAWKEALEDPKLPTDTREK